jgi:hypothetical protein
MRWCEDDNKSKKRLGEKMESTKSTRKTTTSKIKQT